MQAIISPLRVATVMLLSCCVVAISMVGCETTTNQERFDSYLRQPIGKTEYSQYRDFRTELMRSDLLLSTKILANGNEQRRYRFRKGCVVVVEIEGKSRIIVRTSSEGVQEDCLMPN